MYSLLVMLALSASYSLFFISWIEESPWEPTTRLGGRVFVMSHSKGDIPQGNSGS